MYNSSLRGCEGGKMKIRKQRMHKEKELPKAGARSSGLHSSGEGIKLPAKRRNYYDAPTQDYSRTFGWKYFDER